MRKISMLSAGIAMALSGAASAGLNTQVEVLFSGATAPSNMLREHTIQNVCNGGLPITVFMDTVKTAPTATVIAQHTNHWVVQCTAKNNASVGSNLQNKTLAVYKSDPGGSGNGTTPVASQVALEFMNPNRTGSATGSITNCALHTAGATSPTGANSYDLYECGIDDFVQQIPDGGFSDVEPSKFTGPLAPASGDFVDQGNLNIQVGPGLVFGVVVTKAMRDELQADQGLTVGSETLANMPNVPSSAIRSWSQGKQQLWADEPVLGGTLNIPASFVGADGIAGNADDVAPTPQFANQVHHCRRVQGSGTFAQYMMHFHRTNCLDGAIATPGQPGITGGPTVFENSSSGTLGSCLDHLDKGDGFSSSKITPDMFAGQVSFAFGHQSTEKNTDNTENYRYIKVDGVAPTLDNAHKGLYREVYYLSFQNRNDGSFRTGGVRTSAADVAAVNDFFNSNLSFSPAVVRELNKGFVYTWGQGGFVVPSANAAAVFNVNTPTTPWTRVNSTGQPDSCQPLSRVQ